jgi:hypothetical protein
MLVNARNERINKGPIQLVSDPKRPDRAVECAVSCFGCHYTGILPKSDQIRAFVEQNQKHFSPQDVETIRALYPPDAVMRKLMEKDMARFRQAVEKTGGRITASEPILLATLRYEANQELTAVAAEVGLLPNCSNKNCKSCPGMRQTILRLQRSAATSVHCFCLTAT